VANLFILVRILGAGLLFASVYHTPLRHYIALRLAVSVVGGWGIWKTFDDDAWPLSLFFFTLLVGPHIAYGMELGRTAWAVSASCAGVLLLLSIVPLEPGPLQSLFAPPGWKRLVALVTIAFGIGWLLLGAGLIYGSVNSVVKIVRIKLDGREATARITNVEHWVEEDDDTYFDIYRTEYTFRAEDGTEVTNVERLTWNPVDDLSGSDFDAKYGSTYRVDGDTNHPLTIEYETDDPSNSRVAGYSKTFGSILQAIFGVAIGVAVGVLGFVLCKENGREFVGKRT